MLIESLIRRIGGTKVLIGKTNYHFKSEDEAQDPRHLAEVEDKQHQKRFLAIPEGYAVANSDGTPAELPDIVIIGSDAFPASFDIHDKKWSLGDIVVLAQENSGHSVGDWNALPQDERDAFIETALDTLEAAGKKAADASKPQEGIDLQPDNLNSVVDGDGALLPRDTLAAKFEQKFGKAPAKKLTAEDIAAQLKPAAE